MAGTAPSENPSADKRLLIVDDDEDLAASMAMLAESRGYSVTTVYDGAAFRRAIGAFAPAVLVLDLALPDCDGLELLRELARHHSACSVIVVSSHDRRMLDVVPSLGQSLGLDIRGVLQKPFAGKDFLDLL